jgi:hypothetical protein
VGVDVDLTESSIYYHCPRCIGFQDSPTKKVPEIRNTHAMRLGPSYVHAIGRTEPGFPRISIENELAHVEGQADTAGLSDRQALQRDTFTELSFCCLDISYACLTKTLLFGVLRFEMFTEDFLDDFVVH